MVAVIRYLASLFQQISLVKFESALFAGARLDFAAFIWAAHFWWPIGLRGNKFRDRAFLLVAALRTVEAKFNEAHVGL